MGASASLKTDPACASPEEKKIRRDVAEMSATLCLPQEECLVLLQATDFDVQAAITNYFDLQEDDVPSPSFTCDADTPVASAIRAANAVSGRQFTVVVSPNARRGSKMLVQDPVTGAILKVTLPANAKAGHILVVGGSAAAATPPVAAVPAPASASALTSAPASAPAPVPDSGIRRSRSIYQNTEPLVLQNIEEEARMQRALQQEMSPEALTQGFFKAMLVLRRRAHAARAAASNKYGLRRMKSRVACKPSEQSLAAALGEASSGSSSNEDIVAGIEKLTQPHRSESPSTGIEVLDKRLRHVGLRQVVMGDDGNCQFRSFAHNIYGSQVYHKIVRRHAVNYIRNHRIFFSMFFDGDQAFDEYVAAQSQSRTWGDELTMKAVSEAYDMIVHVITSSSENWHLKYTPDGLGQNAPAKEEEEMPPRKICFLTYISPIHYNAIASALT